MIIRAAYSPKENIDSMISKIHLICVGASLLHIPSLEHRKRSIHRATLSLKLYVKFYSHLAQTASINLSVGGFAHNAKALLAKSLKRTIDRTLCWTKLRPSLDIQFRLSIYI